MIKINERVESSSISSSRPHVRWDSKRNTLEENGVRQRSYMGEQIVCSIMA